MIHYHGTPITPNSALRSLAGKNFCVSYFRPDNVKVCHEIGQGIMLDNGAFSAWRSGKVADWDGYYSWVRPWLDFKTTWCVIPDVIGGTEEENNRLLAEWFARMGSFQQAAPVWHLHESFDRLVRLTRGFERVCFGSSAQYSMVGSSEWNERMDAVFNFLCKGTGTPPCWIHMLRGMSLSGGPYPFSSVDSTDIGRNHKSRDATAKEMADRWDALQCPSGWVGKPQIKPEERVDGVLFIDPRAGSKDIVPYFKPYGIEIEMTEMEYGDVVFYGQGENGTTTIAIEHKTVADVVNSMRSGRLAGHQIPGLLRDYDHVVLLVEGIFRCGNAGELEVLKGREWIAIRSGSRPVLYRELSNFFVSLEFICGVVVQRCASPQETAAYIVGLHEWWQKDYSKHDLTKTIYKPDVMRPQRRAGFSRVEPGAVEIVASVLPGVSMKAWEFGKKFKTVEELVTADEKELMSVDGIGKVGAKKIWNWLR